jgi:hypothetical protein
LLAPFASRRRSHLVPGVAPESGNGTPELNATHPSPLKLAYPCGLLFLQLAVNVSRQAVTSRPAH